MSKQRGRTRQRERTSKTHVVHFVESGTSTQRGWLFQHTTQEYCSTYTHIHTDAPHNTRTTLTKHAHITHNTGNTQNSRAHNNNTCGTYVLYRAQQTTQNAHIFNVQRTPQPTHTHTCTQHTHTHTKCIHPQSQHHTTQVWV